MSTLSNIKSFKINPNVSIAQKFGRLIRLYVNLSSKAGLRRKINAEVYDLTFFRTIVLRHDLQLSALSRVLKTANLKFNIAHQKRLMRGEEISLGRISIRLTPLAVIGADNIRTASVSKGGRIYVSVTRDLSPKGNLESRNYTGQDGEICETKVGVMVRDDRCRIEKVLSLIKKGVAESSRTKKPKSNGAPSDVIFADFSRTATGPDGGGSADCEEAEARRPCGVVDIFRH